AFQLNYICYLPVGVCDEGWKKIAELCLPVTHQDYPCRHGERDDITAAFSRLNVPDTRKYSQSIFKNEMHPHLKELVEKQDVPAGQRTLEAPLAESSLDNTNAAPISFRPMDMVMMSALDPGIAQMLGLYFVDEKASPGTRYDYKLVGAWTRNAKGSPVNAENLRANDLQFLDFKDFQVGREGNSHVLRGYGFRWGSPNALKRIRGSRSSVCIGIDGRARLFLPRAMSIVHLDFQTSTPVGIRVHKGDGSTEEIIGLRETLIDFERGIVGVELFGRGKLCRFGYQELDYSWKVLNQTVAVRPRIDSPTGLNAHLLPGRPAKHPDNPNVNIMVPGAVGLKWNLEAVPIVSDENDGRHTMNAIANGQHIMYEVERQDLGREIPDVINGKGFKSLNGDVPTLVTRMDPGAEPQLPPEWPSRTQAEIATGIPALFFIDQGGKDKNGRLTTPLDANHHYAYRLIGIDIFGRKSLPGRTETVLVEDNTPPPPPILLQAKWLDPADTLLKDSERRRIEVNGGAGLFLIWEWTPEMHRIAPDADSVHIEFRRTKNAAPARIETLVNILQHAEFANTMSFSNFIPFSALPSDFRPDAETPMLTGHVSMRAEDLNGNKSAESSVQPFFMVNRELPPTPRTPDIPGDWTTIPNFEGEAFFSLDWVVNRSEFHYFHQVLRCNLAELIVSDRNLNP
ncbi:MAG: hypothetical protein AAF570_15675, partial [Bacteroidota bacterium]